MSQQSFRRLVVAAPVVEARAARNITQPFDIQERALPDALSGLDVLVRSPTGSGKTLAFALPIVERTEPADGRPSALVLVPTRELAAQVTDELEPLARARGLAGAPAHGGGPPGGAPASSRWPGRAAGRPSPPTAASRCGHRHTGSRAPTSSSPHLGAWRT